MLVKTDRFFDNNYIINVNDGEVAYDDEIGIRIGGFSISKTGVLRVGDTFKLSGQPDGYTYLGRIGESGIIYEENFGSHSLLIATDEDLTYSDRFEIIPKPIVLFDPYKLPPTSGNDHRIGNGKENVMHGLGGNDKLEGRNGADKLYGNGGADTLYGGNGRDKLVGGTGDDWLLGEAGADKLRGGKGDDRLSGGAGNDWLKGGAGADTFDFDSGWGRDTIADFDVETDQIDLYSIFWGGGLPDSMKIRNVDDGLLLKYGADSILLEDLTKADFDDIHFIA